MDDDAVGGARVGHARRGRARVLAGDLAAGQHEVTRAGPELDGRLVKKVDRFPLFPELSVHDLCGNQNFTARSC